VGIIHPKALTAHGFSRFGDVIEVGENQITKVINQGHTVRHHDLAKIDVAKNSGEVLVNIFRSNPLAHPLHLNMMERHPLSSQAFMPLGSEPYLVVVAPAGEFDESKIEVFLASSNQGVNYHAGTWHHFCLALNKQSDFLVIDRGGDEENCDEVELSTALEISLDDIALDVQP